MYNVYVYRNKKMSFLDIVDAGSKQDAIYNWLRANPARGLVISNMIGASIVALPEVGGI